MYRAAGRCYGNHLKAPSLGEARPRPVYTRKCCVKNVPPMLKEKARCRMAMGSWELTAQLLQVAKGPKHVHNVEAVALLAESFDLWRRDHHHRGSEVLLYPFLHLHGAPACAYSSSCRPKPKLTQACSTKSHIMLRLRPCLLVPTAQASQFTDLLTTITCGNRRNTARIGRAGGV